MGMVKYVMGLLVTACAMLCTWLEPCLFMESLHVLIVY